MNPTMNPTPKHFSFKAMGNFCEIQLFAESRIHAKKLANQLTAEVARLEKKYSRFREDSFLSEINSSAGNKLGLAIDDETQSLFDHALNCFEQSDGLLLFGTAKSNHGGPFFRHVRVVVHCIFLGYTLIKRCV